MMRRLGVLVALCALAATASADKAKPKAPPVAKKAPPPADTDQPPADDGAPVPDDGTAGSDAAESTLPHITGPQLVDLGHDTEIDLPAGMTLFEHDAAKQMIEKGGGTGENVTALLGPDDPNQTWYITIDYNDVGYVKDSDANDLDPNDLFNQYKQGTEQDNVNRRARGIPELFLDDWSEMPKYDKPTHKLVWGFKAHSTEGPNVNYFSRLLGRNGYMSVDLVDSPDRIEQAKQQAAGVMAAIRFKKGTTYDDHKGGDKDSGMGLKALIVGGAGIAVFKAAKGGWIIAALLAMKKLVIVVAIGIGAFFKKIGRLFTRRSKKVELPPDGPPPGDPNIG
jgi:uncharacterized membrane-anchored protein